MGRGTIESTDFRSLVEGPLPKIPLKYYLPDMYAFNDLTELWGTELSRTIGLDRL